MSLLTLAGGKEIGTALFVFLDPLLRETAVANLGKNFVHFFPGVLCNYARAGGIVALLRSVANRVAHITQAATVDEVDDKLHFMKALEVSNFGLVTGSDESLPASLNEFADAAAENRLLAEEVSLGFFGECGFKNAGASAAESLRVGKSL